MICGIFITVLLIVMIIGAFVVDNLLTQIKQLESHIQEITERDDKIEEEVMTYYYGFLKVFGEAYTQMKRIDKRGSFSSDDEVGFSFKVILKAIEDVTIKLQSMQENPEEEQKPEKR